MIQLVLFFVCLEIQADKIAIIGGGVSGHYLAKLLRDHQVTLFDSSDSDCGRVRTIDFDGKKFEAGGSVLHPANKHVSSIMKEYGLRKTNLPSRIPSILGADETGLPKWSFLPSGSDFFDKIALMWQYGIDILYRIPSKVKVLIDKLDKVYKNQENGKGYKSLVEMLNDLDLYYETQISGEKQFSDIPSKTRDDIISSIMTNNYSNQSLSTTTGLVTSVSMACFGNELFSIKGGNQQLCTAIKADLSKSNDFKYKIMKIKHIENIGGKIQVDTEVFDKIVLAGPIDVQIQNVKYPQYDMNYQSTVVSYFKGKLNVEYLKCSKEIGCPDVVLVGESGRQKLFFNSIQRMADVNGELTDIYKVFSERVLTSEQISKLFKKVHEINEVDWLAYPKYDLSLNLSKIQFKLTDSIFTTQPIELAASCIEMSLIGAHNVANLILSDPTVPAEPVKQIKTEL